MKKTTHLTLFSLIFLIFNLVSYPNASAEEYAYQGKVEGMVCAFCVYNVSNKIRELPSINKDSVNVDLKSGQVEFRSRTMIDPKVVKKLFVDSGFTLATLEQVNQNQLTRIEFSKTAKVSLNFPKKELSEMGDLLEQLGNIAESKMSLVMISAAKKVEMDVLKPIIAGRQQTIKVKYIAGNSDDIKISLFPLETKN